MGSKISVFIILLAMVLLAGLVTESPPVTDGEETAQPGPLTYEETEQEQKKEQKDFVFENFPLEEDRYEGEVASVDFSTNPLAKNFEEIITKSVNSIGVNFAGAYSIATWSCGSLCQNSAIIDVRDGRILAYGIISAYGLSYSPGSTLLIINPPENISELTATAESKNTETDYYSLVGGELQFEGKRIDQGDLIEDCIQAITNARNTITNEVLEFSTPCKVPFGWEFVP